MDPKKIIGRSEWFGVFPPSGCERSGFWKKEGVFKQICLNFDVSRTAF
jgi:hypothetical protein